MLEILHYCPAAVATGGTESIHKLVSELNKINDVHARIIYKGNGNSDPRPTEYERYGCEYLTELPKGFRGVIIFPEIWGNQVTDPIYKDCVTAINWAGVDVYDWNVPIQNRGLFLQNKKTVHLCQLDYAVDHLKSLGVDEIYRISDVLNEDFFTPYKQERRNNVILYNPCGVKLTKFQRAVMGRATTELGLKFKPLAGFTRDELIDIMRHSKLYIDFGVFSGRERLPREAAICGCCVLTSISGAAGYYTDVSIPDKYKFPIDDLDKSSDVVEMMRCILNNYDGFTKDFDDYRKSILQDRDNLPKQCEIVCRRFTELCHDLVC